MDTYYAIDRDQTLYQVNGNGVRRLSSHTTRANAKNAAVKAYWRAFNAALG